MSRSLFNGLILSSLFLLTAFTGCGGDSPSPQSNGDSTGAPAPIDAPVVNDAPVPVPPGNLETAPQVAESSPDRDSGPVYAVAEYDADRDPQMDLDATIPQARSEGKRILLEIGGNW